MRVQVLVVLFRALLSSQPAKSQTGSSSQFQPATKRICESPDAPLSAGCGAHEHCKVGRFSAERYYSLTLKIQLIEALKEIGK